MDDLGPALPCVNCALVVNTEEEEELGALSIFLIPGLFFLVIGLRWWLLLVSKWSREGRARALQDAGLPPAPPPCTRPLPWEGTTKILLTILAASLTLALPTQGPATLLLLSLYLFFLLSGLIDVLIFFCGYTVLPEGIQSFILALAFTMEAVVFQAIVPTAPHALLLLLVITSCALSSILEVVFDNKLVKFCRTFFTCVQASWLLHLAFLPSSPLSSTWAALLFSWHLAGLFTIHLVLLLLYSHLTRAPSLPTTLPSPSGSASQLVTCKFLALPPGPKPCAISPIPSTNGRSLAPSVVDMEPWDRLHYSTFGKPV